MRELPAETGVSEDRNNAPRPSVLVADSDTNMLFTLEFLLRRENFDVRCAMDGTKALDHIQVVPPDVVLLEVELAGLHGYELCQQLRSMPACHATKIIIVSEKCHELEIEKGLALGADAYIAKPFSTSHIISQVRKFLHGSETNLASIAAQKNPATASKNALNNNER